MAGELTNYQYYGLIGKGISGAAASYSQGSAAKTSAMIESVGGQLTASGYDATAEAYTLQSEMETIAADAEANARLEALNETLTRNSVANIAMGRTNEGSVTAVENSNVRAANADVSVIKKQGELKSVQSKSNAISAKKNASASRSAAKQSTIAGNAAYKQGMIGAVTSLASVGASYGQLQPTK